MIQIHVEGAELDIVEKRLYVKKNRVEVNGQHMRMHCYIMEG